MDDVPPRPDDEWGRTTSENESFHSLYDREVEPICDEYSDTTRFDRWSGRDEIHLRKIFGSLSMIQMLYLALKPPKVLITRQRPTSNIDGNLLRHARCDLHKAGNSLLVYSLVITMTQLEGYGRDQMSLFVRCEGVVEELSLGIMLCELDSSHALLYT